MDEKDNSPVQPVQGDSKDLYPNPKDRKAFLITGIACIALSPVFIIIKGKGSPGLAAGILILVGAFLIYGVIYAKRRVKYEEYLFHSGMLFWAEITDCIVHRDYYRHSNRYTNSYTLVCRYKDKNGAIQVCQRYALGYDPRPYINAGQVKVYVDPAKPMSLSSYVIDILGSMDSQPDYSA